mgnify:CR=1 FL=1
MRGRQKIRISLVNFSQAPVHERHLEALKKACNENHKFELTTQNKADVIYFQSSSIKNLPLYVKNKIDKKAQVLYLHEYMSVKDRLKKHDSIIYALKLAIGHAIDTFFTSFLITSSQQQKEKLEKSWLQIFNPKILIKPLTFPDIPKMQKFRSSKVLKSNDKINILFIGRSNPDQRMLNQFFHLSSKLEFCNFMILTKNALADVPPTVSVIRSGELFSEDERVNALQIADVVWTPYSVPYNQSGVVADALCHGCALVISQYESDQDLKDSKVAFTVPNNPQHFPTDEFIRWLEEFHHSAASYRDDARKLFLNKHSVRADHVFLDQLAKVFSRAKRRIE